MRVIPDRQRVKKIAVQTADGRTVEGVLDTSGRLWIDDQPLTADEHLNRVQKRQGKPVGEVEKTDDPNAQPDHRGNKRDDLPKIVEDKTFLQKLASIMKDNNSHRHQRGRLRGKLDMKSLHKIPTGARSVFQQRDGHNGKRYNVVMVIDESGSMADDDRMRTAANTAAFLAHHFDKLGINLAIVGFSSETRVRKNFDTKMSAMAIQSVLIDDMMGDGTDDTTGLKHGFDMFKGREDEENILIFMGDGDGGVRAYNHTLVRRRQNVAQAFGFGIETQAQNLPNMYQVDDLETLKPAVLTALQMVIKRG